MEGRRPRPPTLPDRPSPAPSVLAGLRPHRPPGERARSGAGGRRHGVEVRARAAPRAARPAPGLWAPDRAGSGRAGRRG